MILEIKKTVFRLLLTNGADEGTRTPTVARQILSLVRLPISPHPQLAFILYMCFA